MTSNQLELHPAAILLPALTADEYQNLKDSIAANGQRQPIQLFEGKILDGIHRYRACTELGIEPKTVEVTTADPVLYVFGINVQRRQLRQGQIAAIAATLVVKNKPGRRPSSNVRHGHLETFKTVREAADALKVSRSKVQEAVTVYDHDPDLLEQVRSGKRSLESAVGFVRKQQEANRTMEIEKEYRGTTVNRSSTPSPVAESPTVTEPASLPKEDISPPEDTDEAYEAEVMAEDIYDRATELLWALDEIWEEKREDSERAYFVEPCRLVEKLKPDTQESLKTRLQEVLEEIELWQFSVKKSEMKKQ